MGMDVYGKAATEPVGEYFRNNVWCWRPLADYVLSVAPTLANKCKHWHTNDGAGLNAADSMKLADILEAEVESGRTAAYAMTRQADFDAMPSEACKWCAGTGVRTDAVGLEHGMIGKRVEAANRRQGQVGWCNGCDGAGMIRPHDTWYHFDLDNVREFIAFLRACGGFAIN
jgi:hypothetical protein